MRMPWTKSATGKSVTAATMSKSEAGLAGEAGDGKVHDLAYWLESGFLTLPKAAPDEPKQP